MLDLSVTISDLLGREIATIAPAKYSAGYHSVRCAETDATGNKFGSGVYFYRIETPGGSETGRFTLLK